jgi:hypothetical protein
VRELCFAKCGPNGNGGSVITRATPSCRLALRKALRFVGRFEFLGTAALHTDISLGLKVFEALDFGTEDYGFEDGRRVLLRCYSREKSYLQEVRTTFPCYLSAIDWIPNALSIHGADFYCKRVSLRHILCGRPV